jgi:threonine aldolase
VIGRLAARDVHVTPFGPQTVRITTHRDLSDEDIDATVAAIRQEFATVEA